MNTPQLLIRLSGVDTISGHTFIPSMIGPDSTVLDLGANEGLFSHSMNSRYRCRCVAVEPTPELAGRIRSRGGVEVIESAAAARDGVATFHIASCSQASSLRDLSDNVVLRELSVETRSLKTLMTDSGIDSLDLLKMDIEGAESEVLMSAPDSLLRRIKQISVEFHRFCGLTSLSDLESVKAKLLGCGFEELDFEPRHMNTLFIRRELFSKHSFRLMVLKHLVAPARRLLHQARSRSTQQSTAAH